MAASPTPAPVPLTYPHPDPRVLHAPRVCRFCDNYPDRQRLREAWEINFTGQHDENKALCPAEWSADIEALRQWLTSGAYPDSPQDA